MHARFVVPSVMLAIVFAEAPLRAQGEVTTAPVGSGFSNFSLACPFNMLMIGATSHDALPRTLKCSLYRADGHRFGPVVTQDLPTTTNPGVELIIHSPSFIEDPLVSADCPGDRAANSFHVWMEPDPHPHGISIVSLQLYCAGITAGGGQTVSTFAGTLPVLTNINAVMACPGQKFIRGITGVNGGLALLCTDLPLMATTVGSVGLGAQHVISGTAVAGTVSLNGYAVGTTSITLSIVGAPGAFVPSPIVVPDGAHSATFQVQSAPSTAGCGTVKALVAGTTGPVATGSLFFTPVPPSGASFSFALQPEHASLIWDTPSTITAMVVIPSTKSAAVIGVLKHSPTVTFESDRPDVLGIQTSTQRIAGDTTKVTMSALAAGCAVLTANVDGVVWRKTLRFAAGFGQIESPVSPTVRAAR